jgi:hypothetical protein
MQDNTQQSAAAAGESAGRKAGSAIGGAAQLASKTAARTREEVEDVFADARAVADRTAAGVSGRDAAMYVGLAATTALGVVEWPVAAAAGVGYVLLRRLRDQGTGS